MTRESEECRWGQHDQCPGCKGCTCHPRMKWPKRPVVDDLPQTQMRGATWQPEDAA